jgi:hypothetical protein
MLRGKTRERQNQQSKQAPDHFLLKHSSLLY